MNANIAKRENKSRAIASPSFQDVVAPSYGVKLQLTCHIIYLPTDQVYCRFVLVMISFPAFHFCTIIAVVVTCWPNATTTIYRHFRPEGWSDLHPPNIQHIPLCVLSSRSYFFSARIDQCLSVTEVSLRRKYISFCATKFTSLFTA
jgi:hypothetical protein